MADLDGAGGLDPVSVPEPLPQDVLHRQLAHKHSVLVLLDVQVLQTLEHQNLSLWWGGGTMTEWLMRYEFTSFILMRDPND